MKSLLSDPRRKRLHLFFMLAVLSFLQSAGICETRWGWFVLYPRDRVVPHFSANPVAYQFSAGQILKNRNVVASVGGILRLVNLEWDSFKAQLSVGSAVYAYLDPPEEVNLISTDFYVDFVIIDIPLSNSVSLRVSPGHTSHHLSDGKYGISGLEKPVGYVRDFWDLFVVYRLAELRGFVYAGAYYNYTYQIDKEINKPWLLELGGEFFRTPIDQYLEVYVAADIRLRNESHYATTQNYQVGVRFLNEGGSTVRIALDYRAGVEERGQFIQEHNRWLMLAAYIEL